MKKVIILLSILAIGSVCYAEEIQLQADQQTRNEKSNASINLNSEIVPNGNAKKQGITNIGSWFNININRYTYKFYAIPDDKTENR